MDTTPRSFRLLSMLLLSLLACDDGPPTGTGNEEPHVLFIGVQNDRHDVPPCAGTGPCTVPWSARLSVRFTGSAEFGSLEGFNWQIQRPHLDAELSQPFDSDTLFLAAGRDTQAVDERGLPLWTLVRDTVVVYFNAAKEDTFTDVGSLAFMARVRGARGGTDFTAEGLREIDVVDPFPPTVGFLEVRPEREDLPPCVAAEPCTIPMFTSFKIRFRGRSEQNWVRGYTWSSNLDLWEPYHTPLDTLFLPVGMDTVAVASPGDTLWSLAGEVLTVHQRSDRAVPVPPQNLLFRARVRDDALLVSRLVSGTRIITINFDPDTRLYSAPSCDCPLPPPDCANLGPQPVGWITAIGNVDPFPIDAWIPFCAGDTLPNESHVRFYAQGWDDPRDLPIDPVAGFREVPYRWRYEISRGDFMSTNMPYSLPATAAADLPLPGGGTFRGGVVGWVTCPFDYLFQAGAVDEQGKVDGTPAEIRFHVGGAPTLDSVTVAPVIVFVPRCNPNQASYCAGFEPVTFGSDTLAVYGTPVPDPGSGPGGSNPWVTPLGLGWNDFVFPFRAYGHDHPRDRNPPGGPLYYDDATAGRIRSWMFAFDCDGPGCQDASLVGEHIWREDVRAPGESSDQQVFDPTLRIRIPLDTLCVSSPCTGDIVVRLDYDRFGPYVFSIIGRDTEYLGQTCNVPSDLGENPALFPIPISERGLQTRLETRRTMWLQLGDVRRPPIQSARR